MTAHPSVILAGSLIEILQNLSAFGAIILIILVVMSLVSWMIIFRKFRQFRGVVQDGNSFLNYFRRAQRLEEIAGQAQTYRSSPLAGIFNAGFRELTALKERKNDAGSLGGQVARLSTDEYELVEMAMERSLNDEVEKLERQVVFLATTGSSAPFLGLLGTVVGIMDSFWSIGKHGSASLAIVAPGIAEALLATIVGLGAAIPAVIAYNWANNRLKVLQSNSTNFMLEFIARCRKEGI